MTEFKADLTFEAGSVFAVDWPLCQVRLQDDARFAWLILLPRVEGAVELDDLSLEQRAALMEEVVRAGEVVRALAEAAGRPIDKLNTAALGNVTRQLHIHVVGRRRDDGLWPDPIWGRPDAVRLSEEDREALLRVIREA